MDQTRDRQGRINVESCANRFFHASDSGSNVGVGGRLTNVFRHAGYTCINLLRLLYKNYLYPYYSYSTRV